MISVSEHNGAQPNNHAFATSKNHGNTALNRRVPSKRPPLSPRPPVKKPGQPRAMPAPLKAAVIMLIPFLLVQFIGARLFIVPLIGYYLVNVALYLINGYLAGGFYFSAHRKLHPFAKTEVVKDGAAAGLTLSIVGWIVYALLALLFNLGHISLGAGVIGLNLIICGPLDVIAGLLLGASGAKLYENLNRL